MGRTEMIGLKKKKTKQESKDTREVRIAPPRTRMLFDL